MRSFPSVPLIRGLLSVESGRLLVWLCWWVPVMEEVLQGLVAAELCGLLHTSALISESSLKVKIITCSAIIIV